MKNLVKKIIEVWNNQESSREQLKQLKFAAEARQQLLLLKEKGLGISVFTF